MKIKLFIIIPLVLLFSIKLNAINSSSPSFNSFSVPVYSHSFQHKNALKTTFLSFYTGSAKITYERVLKMGNSIEFTLGGICLGYDSFKNKPRGALFRFAYKFIFFPDINYPLNGFYVKPEFAISCFTYDAESMNGVRLPSNMGTIMGCVGYQWAKHIFLAECFVGMGLGYGNKAETRYHHGFIDRFGFLTFTFGMKVGLSFGKKAIPMNG